MGVVGVCDDVCLDVELPGEFDCGFREAGTVVVAPVPEAFALAEQTLRG